MNLGFGAMTNWGKSYGLQCYVESNAEDYDKTVLIDYKDEYAGLVESGLLERLTVPSGAVNLSIGDWHEILDQNGSLQLARTGATEEDWRAAIGTAIQALGDRDETVFLGIDEAHRIAPQRGSYPEAFDTLATTWHGDGMGVAWATQRYAKLNEDIVAQLQAGLFGGFRSGNDLNKVADVVEYPVEIHKADAERVTGPDLPDALLDEEGDPTTLRRYTDDQDLTIGSEWVYSDDTTLRRVDSRDWDLSSTHYGSDRTRVKHPFED